MAAALTPGERRVLIDRIRQLPQQLEAVVKDLSDEDLGTHYQPGEWNVAQNVHHLADAHMASYHRMKLILSEQNPILQPFDQNRWAEMTDATRPAVQNSLYILKGLHERWCILLESLTEDAWARTGMHLESGKLAVEDMLRYYSQHGEGHIRQIQETLAAKGQPR